MRNTKTKKFLAMVLIVMMVALGFVGVIVSTAQPVSAADWECSSTVFFGYFLGIKYICGYVDCCCDVSGTGQCVCERSGCAAYTE